MRTALLTLLCSMILQSTLLSQEGTFGGTPSFDADDSIAWIDDDAESLPVSFFWQVNADYDSIFPASVDTPPFTGSRVGYGEGNFIISGTRLFSRGSGVNAGIGYTKLGLFWNENPFFHEENFDSLDFSLNGFWDCWNCLEIKGGGSFSLQTNEWEWGYTYGLLTGWGRYIVRSLAYGEIGVNLGVTSRIGLQKGFIYPVAGIDFRPRKHIKVNLVFPIDMAIIYELTEMWSIDLTGRFWNTRRRLNKNEVVPKGYFDYLNSGLQLGVNFSCDPYAFANLHVGTTLGADEFRIADAQDNEVEKLRLKPTPYLGGRVWVRF